MEPLTSIQVFSRVVETGSFTRAAKSLDIGQPAVTRHIAKMEERFGLQLISRNTRGVSPTEHGKRFYEKCQRIIAELEQIDSFSEQERSRKCGVLRLHAPLSFGRNVMSPLLVDFMEANPNIRVDLTCSNAQADFVAQGLDILIRLGPLPDSTLARRAMTMNRWAMIAAPDYLNRKGTPTQIDELALFDGLIYSGNPEVWWRYGRSGRRALSIRERMRSNDLSTIMDATIAGLGLAIVPLYLAAPALRRGDVTQLFKDEPLYRQEINAVFFSTKQQPPKIREFLSFASARFRSDWC